MVGRRAQTGMLRQVRMWTTLGCLVRPKSWIRVIITGQELRTHWRLQFSPQDGAVTTQFSNHASAYLHLMFTTKHLPWVYSDLLHESKLGWMMGGPVVGAME